MLAGVLFGTTRQRVLGWLFGHPESTFYLREIIRRCGAPGAVQRELATLVSAGLLVRIAQGRLVYFQANGACSVFAELTALLARTGCLDASAEGSRRKQPAARPARRPTDRPAARPSAVDNSWAVWS